MLARDSFDAALLAGGRSTRLGQDKAFLDWRGQTLYAVQLRKLAALGPRQLFLSTRTEQNFPAVLEGVTRLYDDPPGLGPLGGLRSILAASHASRVLVLAVDLPNMESAYLRRLLETEGGIVPRTDRGWEPLVAVYPRSAMLALVEQAIAHDHLRLQDLLDEAASQGLIEALPLSPDDQALFANLNTPADLEALGQKPFDETVQLRRYRRDQGFFTVDDRVATEEPLELRVNGTSVAVTMRTPGHDEELATGFLFTEGLIHSVDEISEIVHCPEVDPAGIGNTLDLRLTQTPDLASLTRHLFTSSSCGVCGKATIAAVFGQFPPLSPPAPPRAEVLLSLPQTLRADQETFERTGGLHASALFDREGNLLLLREDVGRHNALDKVIGHALAQGWELDDLILLVSGRLSFELIQKALAARLRIVAAISAPSSLAVRFARESGQTVVGFLREHGFNVYSGKVL